MYLSPDSNQLMMTYCTVPGLVAGYLYIESHCYIFHLYLSLDLIDLVKLFGHNSFSVYSEQWDQ